MSTKTGNWMLMVILTGCAIFLINHLNIVLPTSRLTIRSMSKHHKMPWKYGQIKPLLMKKSTKVPPTVPGKPVENLTQPQDTDTATTTDSSTQHFPFKYLINEPEVCNDKVRIINIIPSKPERNLPRQMIRELWGQRDLLPLTGMITLFLVGETASAAEQNHIQNESRQHHDILQLNIVDTYRNLTLKTLSILHWATRFCPQANWVLKSDDDVIVNPFAINAYLYNHPGHDLICRINTNLDVCRFKTLCKLKWAVSFEEYPNNTYPPYCDGPAYMLTAEMAAMVYSAANKTNPHFIEDAYYTGIVAGRFNPVYSNLERLRFPSFLSLKQAKYWNGDVLFVENRNLKPSKINTYWKKVLNYFKVSQTETGLQTYKEESIKLRS